VPSSISGTAISSIAKQLLQKLYNAEAVYIFIVNIKNFLSFAIL